MNSLNIVSRLRTPPPSPPRSRTASAAHVETLSSSASSPAANEASDATSALDFASLSEKLGFGGDKEEEVSEAADHDAEQTEQWADEKTPSVHSSTEPVAASHQSAPVRWSLAHRIGAAVLYGVKVILSPITIPCHYVLACFYNDAGHFSAILPLTNLKNLMTRRKRKSSARKMGLRVESDHEIEKKKKRRPQQTSSHARSPSVDSNASTTSFASSDGEEKDPQDSPARHTRSKTGAAPQPDALPRKSIRIKEDSLRKRKPSGRKSKAASPDEAAAVASVLKSPTSAAASKLTKYPRSPATPRPLVPRRQPSYLLTYSPSAPRKTLIIDLDETLIHSMAKGGRMSTGHMVEVRLGGPVSNSGVQIGPGVPILYYVHERPGCHEFLRKVSKWYNLIAFTASVQEYADPVVDWLERERKYFSGRYYRQHCTYRNGAYIKDLAQVEPDLSKVMILDNSPMSYIFHEGMQYQLRYRITLLICTSTDNAIPIEGWISDPTDHELLHLIPLLEGLQYCTDVRALLALRHGQAQQA